MDNMTVEPQTKRKKTTNFRINTFTIAASHVLGVRPSGNLLLAENQEQLREEKAKQMGLFDKLPEEILTDILQYIDDPKDLMNLSHTSRVMYAYVYDEELWRRLYTKEFIRMEDAGEKNIHPFGVQNWRGSWRKTILKLDHEALPKLPDNLLCSDHLFRSFQCSQVDYLDLFKRVIEFEKESHDLCQNLNSEFGIDRFMESDFTNEMFREYINKPFILKNTEPGRWPKWTINSLLDKYPHEKFRQEAVEWDLTLYSQYFKDNRDESPLYLFDCNSKAMKHIRETYEPPKVFQTDLFKLFNDPEKQIKCRPDHRWLIVGPGRTGSTFHKDPNYTSAWNANLSGMKLWVMLPPHVKPPGVGTDEEEEEVTSPVGVAEWIISGYYNDSVKLAQQGQCLIGMTFPGECIYVPSGWWHTVINLEDSVALTENFVPEPILGKVMNFFKNKKTQISGFHLKDFVESMSRFVALQHDCIDPERLSVFEKFLADVSKFNLDNEDCGLQDTSGYAPPMDIFFQELISQNEAFKPLLPDALAHVKELELADLKKKIANRETVASEKWTQLTAAPSGAFSFGFDIDSD